MLARSVIRNLVLHQATRVRFQRRPRRRAISIAPLAVITTGVSFSLKLAMTIGLNATDSHSYLHVSPIGTLSLARSSVNLVTNHSSPAVFPGIVPFAHLNSINPRACTNARRAAPSALAKTAPGLRIKLRETVRTAAPRSRE